MSDSPPRRDYLTRFQQQGEMAMARTPLSVRMPADIDLIVRAKSNRTDWLREAIFEKLWREGNLPERYHEVGLNGKDYEVAVMSDAEYVQALRDKLIEEAQEAAAATPQALVGELADLYKLL